MNYMVTAKWRNTSSGPETFLVTLRPFFFLVEIEVFLIYPEGFICSLDVSSHSGEQGTATRWAKVSPKETGIRL